MHIKNTFVPRLANDMTVDDKKEALRYLIFLEGGIIGAIKGGICAEGST